MVELNCNTCTCYVQTEIQNHVSIILEKPEVLYRTEGQESLWMTFFLEKRIT
jgi:hypothetical protein